MNENLATIFEEYQKERYELFPMEATYSGVDGYNDRMENHLDPAFQEKEKAFYEATKAKLISIDRSQLNAKDQMSLDVMLWDLNINLDGKQYPTDLLPIDQMWSFNLRFGQMASGAGAQPFKNVEDYNNWLNRVDVFVDWTKSAQANMQQGIKDGIVLPKSLVKKVIPQIEAWADKNITDHLFYSPVKSIPDNINADQRRKIEDDYAAIIRDKVIPAYTSFSNFLKNEYLDAARTTSGTTLERITIIIRLKYIRQRICRPMKFIH